MQVQNNPKNPREIRPDLPVAIEQIILKAMKKEITQRYQNAEAMLSDIKKFDNDNTIVFNYPKNEQIDNADTIVINKIKTPESEPKKAIELNKKKKSNSRWNHFRNKLLSITAGVFLAFVLNLIGLGTMFTVVNNLSENLVDVPVLVGKAVDDVKADPLFNKDFILIEDLSYHDTIAAGIIIEQQPSEGKYASGKEIKVVISRGKRMVPVPDLRNYSVEQAERLLKESELYSEKILQPDDKVPEGQVIRSEPAERTSVPVGSTVKIYVSYSTQVKQVYVTNVVGMTKARAITALQKQGLYVTPLEEYNPTVPAGEVISQSIEKDTIVDMGTEVIIVVSMGRVEDAIAQGLYTEPASSISEASIGWDEE